MEEPDRDSRDPAEYTSIDDDMAPLAEPERPHMTKAKIVLLNISFFGFNAMYLIMCVEAVPAQIEAMVGSEVKGRWLGGMAAGAALVMFITGPLIGMYSDRIQSRFGKRRPIMLVAALLLCIFLMCVAFSAPEIIIKRPIEKGESECNVDLVELRCRPYANSSMDLQNVEGSVPQTNWVSHDGNFIIERKGAYKGNLGIFIVFFLLVTISMVCFTIPYNALNADLTHQDQRGLSSGIMGAMILLGNIFGATIGLFFVQLGVFMVYGSVVGLVLVCALATIFGIEEPPNNKLEKELPPIDCREIFIGFWEPLKNADFRWVCITRFLMQQGIATVIGFLEFWLQDMVDIPNCWSTQRGLGIILLPMLTTAALGSVGSGIISDKIGKRKALVISGGILMSVASIVLACMQGDYVFYGAIVVAIIFGLGFGTYQSVDFALVMDVLPSDRDTAKDIAVWHEAMILPQAVAAPIGGVLLDLFESVNCRIGLGYIIIFVISSIYFLLSGVLVMHVKGAK